MKIYFHMPRFMLAVFLLTGAFALSAQNGAASALEPARIAILQEDYRTAAKEASKLYFASSDPAVAEEALQLSISANLATPETRFPIPSASGSAKPQNVFWS